MARIEDLFVQLTAKSPAEGYAAMKELQAVSETSDAVYPYMARLIGMLGSDNSYARTRGLLLIAANARWDTDCLIDENLNHILSHITDPKPITARQFIQSLPALASAKPDLRAECWVTIDSARVSAAQMLWVSVSFKRAWLAMNCLINVLQTEKRRASMDCV